MGYIIFWVGMAFLVTAVAWLICRWLFNNPPLMTITSSSGPTVPIHISRASNGGNTIYGHWIEELPERPNIPEGSHVETVSMNLSQAHLIHLSLNKHLPTWQLVQMLWDEAQNKHTQEKAEEMIKTLGLMWKGK